MKAETLIALIHCTTMIALIVGMCCLCITSYAHKKTSTSLQIPKPKKINKDKYVKMGKNVFVRESYLKKSED